MENDSWLYEGPELPIEYIPGGGADFVVFVANHRKNARIRSVDGHARWIITREDGSEYIARPIEAKPE